MIKSSQKLIDMYQHISDTSQEEKENGFKRKISKKKSANKWTNEEYSQLIQLVRKYGEDWAAISAQINHKTAKQCMQKFKNS